MLIKVLVLLLFSCYSPGLQATLDNTHPTCIVEYHKKIFQGIFFKNDLFPRTDSFPSELFPSELFPSELFPSELFPSELFPSDLFTS